MYQIISNNESLGYTDSPEYCYKLPSGSPQVIGRKERDAGAVATGVIYQGVIYNLPGYDEFDGETAYVNEVDEGTVITQQAERIQALADAGADTDAMTVDQELRITMLELGLDDF